MNHLVIRVDADAQIGTGHVMRCLALAQAWQDKGGKVTFISHCESDSLRKRLLNEGMNLIDIENAYPEQCDLECTLVNLSVISHQQPANCWLVIDGYHFDAAYQKRIKEAGYKILWIDDYGHAEHYYADLVLNQNISADESFYLHREPYTQLLLGTRYVLLRREFEKWQDWQREVTDIAHKVLVTMGGADSDNLTLKVIQSLKHTDIPSFEAKIVVGPANPHLTILEREISDCSNLQLIKDASNMPDLMAWADLAVSAGGSTCGEMAFMGLPNIIMIFADNQAAVAAELHNHYVSINLGWHNNINAVDIARALKKLMISDVQRKKMLHSGKNCVDGKGSNRIINSMFYENIILRKASMGDCKLLWEWVNEPGARQSAFKSDFITFDEHMKWYQKKQNDVNFNQYIASNQDNKPIGQIRFDTKNGESEIDISVTKDVRGFGYGACIIKKGVDNLIKTAKINKFSAYIKYSNLVSIKSFEKAGFSKKETLERNGQKAIRMIFQKENNE